MRHIKLMPDLPEDGPLEEHILRCLTERGLKTEGLYYRCFDYTRLAVVLETGTDRDETSRIRGVHDEESIVRALGFSPNIHARQFTWVSPFGKSLNRLGRERIAVAIYDGSHLDVYSYYFIKPDTIISTQGFSKFKNPLGQYPALVAVFKRD